MLAAAGMLLAASLCGGAAQAQAQTAPKPGTEAAPQAVPGFWDPRRRPDRPDLSRLTVIRFLTETDYPPFNFTGPDGNPAGFNVDLARLMCEEIKVSLHDPDAALRDAARRARQQSRRRHHRLDRGDAGVAREGRFHRSLLPNAGAFRVAARRRDGGGASRNSSRARRSASSPAARTRLISRRCSPKPNCGPIQTTTRCGRRCAEVRSI